MEQSKNRIVLFPNQNSDGKKPKLKGYATVNGIEYEIALWPHRNGKQDNYSGGIREKQEKSSGVPDSNEISDSIF